MSGSRAILMTPAGVGAIAVVRLSGDGVMPFLRRHFSRGVSPGRPVHGELRDGDRVIDDPLVLLGPDAGFADVNLHGGPWVVRSVLELARREGFTVIDRPVPPVPEDALGAADALQCEVLAHLPMARTELGVRALLAQPPAWRRLLTDIHKERKSARGLTGQQDSPGPPFALSLLMEDHALHWLLHPPHVAIIGPPNVGKSTLANQLFARERSITADRPGTTRDWVGEIANLDGLPIMLIDTPGYRETADEIERRAIAATEPRVRAAELVLLMFDASCPDDPGQNALLGDYPDALVVLNKMDLAAAAGMPGANQGDLPDITTVATTGQGVDELRRAIRRRFDCDDLQIDRPRCWTRRQREILQAARTDPAALERLF